MNKICEKTNVQQVILNVNRIFVAILNEVKSFAEISH